MAIIFVVAFLSLGAFTGNFFVFKLLHLLGFPLVSGKIRKDARLFLKGADARGWLHVPDVCYAPIMADREGFYRTHDFRGKSSFSGELTLAEDKSAEALKSIALPSTSRFGDLAMIHGLATVKSSSMRYTQFKWLDRYVKTDLKQRYPVISLYDQGKVRNFSLLFAVEVGVEAKKQLRFTDRESFLNQMRSLAHTDTGRSTEGSILILNGVTEIDSSMAFFVEQEG